MGLFAAHPNPDLETKPDGPRRTNQRVTIETWYSTCPRTRLKIGEPGFPRLLLAGTIPNLLGFDCDSPRNLKEAECQLGHDLRKKKESKQMGVTFSGEPFGGQ